MILVTTKARILEYLDYKDISRSEFYSRTNLKRGLLDSDKLEATVPDTVIAKIIANFPDVNIVWLITGEGTMLHKPAAVPDNLIDYLHEKDRKIEELLRENARLKIALGQDAATGEKSNEERIVEVLNRLEEKIDKKGEGAGSAGAVAG